MGGMLSPQNAGTEQQAERLGNGRGIWGTQSSCQVCSFAGRAGGSLLKMAFFALKVEEDTAEAAETDVEGIIYNSVMSN